MLNLFNWKETHTYKHNYIVIVTVHFVDRLTKLRVLKSSVAKDLQWNT